MKPDIKSKPREVIPASEILDKIERVESIEYDGVIIEGDLDLNKLQLPIENVDRNEDQKHPKLSDKLKVIRSKVSITNSEILGNVNFSNALILKPIHFEDAKFIGYANFRGANFNGGNVYFEGAKFIGGRANFQDAIFIGGSAFFSGSKFVADANFQRASFSKYAYFERAEFDGDVNFQAAKFKGQCTNFWRAFFGGNADFRDAKFDGNINFRDTKFSGKYANFTEAEFGGNVHFERASFSSGNVDFWAVKFCQKSSFIATVFESDLRFEGAGFGRDANFEKARFGGNANFGWTEFSANANFERASFDGNASFLEAGFVGEARFWRAKFNGDAHFEIADFGEYANFDHDQFHRNVSFKDAKFGHPASQEVACRIVKRRMEDQGDKKEADDYFYREMEAIRLQNGIRGIGQDFYNPPNNFRDFLHQYRFKIAKIPSKLKRFLIYDILEYIFIQRVFGYGVRPFNVAKPWLSVVFFLGVVYWAGAGVVRGDEPLEWYEYFYFSIVTAATPGYAGYTPATGFYTLIAGAQAIFGTFMWAAFIATFARKWQR